MKFGNVAKGAIVTGLGAVAAVEGWRYATEKNATIRKYRIAQYGVVCLPIGAAVGAYALLRK